MATLSDSVRVFPYPALEPGNLSFPDGLYKPVVDSLNDALHVQHVVEHASLIENLINDKKAACVCTVSVPMAGYRKIYRSDNSSQKIKISDEWLAEPPLLRPYIVCTEDIKHKVKKSDGTHDMWVDREVHYPKGAKIAFGPVYRLMSSIQSLLAIDKDENLSPGQMRTEACSEEGFYFRVKVAPDLHNFIQSPGNELRSLHRKSILIHAMSTCFALLAKDYAKDDDGWRTYPNLKALASEMENKGLAIWDEEEFCPDYAATQMVPHPVPVEQDDDA